MGQVMAERRAAVGEWGGRGDGEEVGGWMWWRRAECG